jgi:formylglycine-generating enzyme required for sulfatase activity
MPPAAATGATPAKAKDAGQPARDAGRRNDATVAIPPGPPAQPFDYGVCKHADVEARCADGFCSIPAGCFVMGSPEDEWGHAPTAEQRTVVTLSHAFAMQEHEVTRAEWMAHGLPDPSGKRPDGTGNCTDADDCPVGNVSWFDAVSYANLLSKQHNPPLPACYELVDCTGQLGADFVCKSAKQTSESLYGCLGFRLPTDAEWEYAARAGTNTAVYTGTIARLSESGACASEPNLERIAWYCNNSAGVTHPVRRLEPNGWGLFDMIGNVAEWVNDYDRGLPPSAARDPGSLLEPDPKLMHPFRIARGCNYYGWSALCRAAYQYSGSWDARAPGIGIRLVRTLPQ